MENLYIEKTKDTPEINFNAETGILSISGESYPENAFELYKNVFEWLNLFFQQKRNVVINFRLEYFNTSSSKCILDILDLLEEYQNQSGKVEINWFYREGDDDILENGEEFAEDLSIPFNFKTY